VLGDRRVPARLLAPELAARVFEWRYEQGGRVADEGSVLIRPYGGEEGSGYGEGRGTASGERLRGEVVWSNHPHRRSDGRMLLTFTG
jgi:hypothetical protein